MGVIRVIQIAEKHDELNMNIKDIMDSIPNKYYPEKFKYNTYIKVTSCTGKFHNGYYFKVRFLNHDDYDCDKVFVVISADNPTTDDVNNFITKLLTENVVGDLSPDDIDDNVYINKKSLVFILKIPTCIVDGLLDKITLEDQQPCVVPGNRTIH